MTVLQAVPTHLWPSLLVKKTLMCHCCVTDVSLMLQVSHPFPSFSYRNSNILLLAKRCAWLPVGRLDELQAPQEGREAGAKKGETRGHRPGRSTLQLWKKVYG